jgi:putative hydrolase of the HAD superfamily
MPRPILFDLFGVIAVNQTPEDRHRIEAIAGVDPQRFWETYWALRKPYDAGQPSADYWAAVADRLGVRFDSDQIRDIIAADLASWTNVDEDMVGLIGELADEGHSLGLLSNIIGDLVPILEERHRGWLSRFTALTYSCEIGVAKPDRQAFEIALDRLGVAPADGLFFGDNEASGRAARALGMHAEVFTGPAQIRRLLAA